MSIRYFPRRQTIQSIRYGHRAFQQPFRTSNRRLIHTDTADPENPSFGKRVKRKIGEWIQGFIGIIIVGTIVNLTPTWDETLDATCRIVPPRIVPNVADSPILSEIYNPAATPDSRTRRKTSCQKIRYPNEFRVLVLEPGSGEDEVRCSMINVRPSWRTRYDALSYTWGDESIRKQIVVGDGQVSITRNLYSALVNLRHPKHRSYLWADALCINQDDLEERDDQVKKMGAIYMGARNVVIWLGEETQDVKGAFSLIKESKRTEGLNDMSPALNLLRRPWFQRTWIIQEAVLARKPVLACGREKMLWEEFSTLCTSDGFQEFVPDSDPEIDQALKAIDMITHGRHEHHTQYLRQRIPGGKRRYKKEKYTPEFGLVSTLYETRGFQCKDKRDKVFGVLSMATNVTPGDDVLNPNYRASIEEVLQTVAMWDIDKNKSLEILSYCSRKEGTHPDLPSWVPDFTDLDESHSILFLERMKLTPRQKNAHRQARKKRKTKNPGLEATKTSQPYEFKEVDNKSVLVVRGQILDTIARVGEVAENPKMVTAARNKEGKHCPRLDVSALSRRQKWFNECVRIAADADPAAPPPPNGSAATTFWKSPKLGLSSYQLDCFVKAMSLGKLQHNEPLCEYATLINDCLLSSSGVDTEERWHKKWKEGSGGGGLFKTSQKNIDGYFRRPVHKRRFFATKSGRLGWAPGAARKGDIVCQISGAQVPIILRRVSVPGRYMVVGDAYVNGLMLKVGEDVYTGGDEQLALI